MSSNAIIFNPDERPSLFRLVLDACLTIYLWKYAQTLQIPETSSSSMFLSDVTSMSAVRTLLGFKVFEIIVNAIDLYRDRHDFIAIENSSVSYKDNKIEETIPFISIASVEPGWTEIQLVLENHKVLKIPTAHMNFSFMDSMTAGALIKIRTEKTNGDPK